MVYKNLNTSSISIVPILLEIAFSDNFLKVFYYYYYSISESRQKIFLLDILNLPEGNITSKISGGCGLTDFQKKFVHTSSKIDEPLLLQKYRGKLDVYYKCLTKVREIKTLSQYILAENHGLKERGLNCRFNRKTLKNLFELLVQEDKIDCYELEFVTIFNEYLDYGYKPEIKWRGKKSELAYFLSFFLKLSKLDSNKFSFSGTYSNDILKNRTFIIRKIKGRGKPSEEWTEVKNIRKMCSEFISTGSLKAYKDKGGFYGNIFLFFHDKINQSL